MSTSFPYKKKQIEEGTICDPLVDLRVKTSIGKRKFQFLVDSGADTTCFPLEWQYLFKDSINYTESTIIGGVEGGSIKAYPAKIEIKIGKIYYSVRCVFIESNIVPLLGRLDVWNNFSILFDNKKGVTNFQKLV